MKLFTCFLALVSGAVIREITIELDDSELERSPRDLIHWNRQSNNSYKLRNLHFSEMMGNENVNYLEQIKAFLQAQSDSKARRSARQKRHMNRRLRNKKHP